MFCAFDLTILPCSFGFCILQRLIKVIFFLIFRSGDITKLNTIAIVNTTNESLSSKGMLSERIHRAAGPELLQECKTQLLGQISLF